MLRVAVVRTVGEPDRFYVTRSNGTETSWSFATYGDALPHDLVHLVVESAFGLARGFWGRVDEGVDPKLASDEANRKGGRDKYAAYGPDRSELMLAEALANADWSSDVVQVSLDEACAQMAVAAPPQVSRERILELREVLARLSARWRALRPKGALDLTFDRAAPRRSFEVLAEAALAGKPPG